MPPITNAERIAWGVILFTLGAFMLGTWFNRRRGKELGHWIDAGIKALGGQPAWTFIKSVSSGAEVTIRNANSPYRTLESGYYLLTREIPPLYLIELLRRKGDLFSIKAELRTPPADEYDVVPLTSKLRRELDTAAGAQPIQWLELPNGLGLATRAADPQKLASRLKPFAERYGKALQRLSVRTRHPNVMMFMHFNGVEDRPSQEIFDALRRVV
jgi:hypothetical protein